MDNATGSFCSLSAQLRLAHEAFVPIDPTTPSHWSYLPPPVIRSLTSISLAHKPLHRKVAISESIALGNDESVQRVSSVFADIQQRLRRAGGSVPEKKHVDSMLEAVVFILGQHAPSPTNCTVLSLLQLLRSRLSA